MKDFPSLMNKLISNQMLSCKTCFIVKILNISIKTKMPKKMIQGKIQREGLVFDIAFKSKKLNFFTQKITCYYEKINRTNST